MGKLIRTRKKCGKDIRPARNGVDRGTCTLPRKHMGGHASDTCSGCGVALTAKNWTPGRRKPRQGRMCKHCLNARKRDYLARHPYPTVAEIQQLRKRVAELEAAQ